MTNDAADKAGAVNGSAGAGNDIRKAGAAAGNKDASVKKIGGQGELRSFFVFQVLVGYEVEVKLKDGATYRGIFSSIRRENLILRMARLVRDASGEAPRATRAEPTKTIPVEDWLEINAIDVRLGAADVGALGAQDDAGGFGTDSAISRGRGAAEGRELQRWTPDIDEGQLTKLEDSVSAQRGWDQFALNESKFGVQTDYHEELYTTALDPTKSKISMKEAERLAAEIERGNKMDTTNIHLLEERGIEIDDGDMDEEDRYGAVIRNPGEKSSTAARAAPPPPPRPAGAWGRGAPASAPISIDSRKEANKVRAQITGGASGGKAASPYGTPKQLASPLVGDAQKLAALNLDPGMPRFDAATQREFEAFKAQQQGRSQQGGAVKVAELKQFSEAMESKLQKTLSGEKGAAAAGTGTPGGSAEKAAASDAPAKSSSLNPNAKAFTLNFNAKSFTPTFTPKTAAAAPVAAAGAPAPLAVAAAPVTMAAPRPAHAGPPGAGPSRPYRGPDADGGDAAGPVPPHYARKRDDMGMREDRGPHDYRRGGADRRHHDMRMSPPYVDGGHGPPPGHARSPPTGAMPMAPTMGMVPGMGYIQYLPVGVAPGMAGPGGVPPRGVPGQPMLMYPGGYAMAPAGPGRMMPGAGMQIIGGPMYGGMYGGPPPGGPGGHRGGGGGNVAGDMEG